MITNVTRSSIHLSIDGHTVTIQGEAFLPGHGSPDFVAYRNTLTEWDDGEPLAANETQRILDDLMSSADERGLTIELE